MPKILDTVIVELYDNRRLVFYRDKVEYFHWPKLIDTWSISLGKGSFAIRSEEDRENSLVFSIGRLRNSYLLKVSDEKILSIKRPEK